MKKKVVPLPEEKRELIINSRKMAKSLKTTDNVIHCYEEICQLAHDDTKLKMDYFDYPRNRPYRNRPVNEQKKLSNND